MNDRFFMTVTWGARKETLALCTSRAERFFRTVARSDPALSRWYQLGRSRKDALSRPVTPDGPTLRKLLAAGRNRTDVGRRVLEELGFDLWLWNGGEEDESVRVQINCGCFSRSVGNSCVLDLPEDGPIRERLLRIPALIQIITCMVDAWDPDDGLVTSSSYFDLRPEANERDPRVGWLVYVSNRLGRVPLVPAPATVVPVGTKGSLIITTPERFSVDNPAHVAAADGVLAALEATGLRKPITK